MIRKLFLFSILSFISFALFSQGGESCDNATDIFSIPYEDSGNTTGTSDDYFASCEDVGNPGGAPDLVYVFTNGANEVYVDVSLCQDVTDYDCQLYIYENSCTGSPIACQEDGCQSPAYNASYNSVITAFLFEPNTTYYIIVDGYNSDSYGNFQLNIEENNSLGIPESSNLPLIFIDTFGESIEDEPKTTINLKIIHNGPEELNLPTDPGNVYDGFAGIEIRGNYSASLPQKPFGIETRDELGENNNVEILGMPEENDWILMANYNDKTFLRNVLAYNLFDQMGHYAPRTKLCEVIINDIYEGIYVFTEKIKRDNNRVDIARLDADDNAGDSLTGGYIFRIDYWNNNNSWISDYENPNVPGEDVHFVYNYPGYDDISNQQSAYLQNKVSEFEDALWGANFTDPNLGYRNYIDVESFLDYFIVNTVTRNVDGFKKSRNFHKDKDSKDPLIYAGPVWDFDWAYKNMWEGQSDGSGWFHNTTGSDVTYPGWYLRMLQDSTFATDLSCRYFDLRNSILNTDTLFAYIDDYGILLDEAQERHYARWPILGQSVGAPDIDEQPTTYAGELIKFKSWIEIRLNWLDINMPGFCPNVGLGELDARETYWSFYPNPSNEVLQIYAENTITKINVYSIEGKLIKSIGKLIFEQFSLDTSELQGVFLLELVMENGEVLMSKFISE